MMATSDFSYWYAKFKNNVYECYIVMSCNDGHPLNICIIFQDRVLINQWKDEIINGFKLSSQIMQKMNKKATKLYGGDACNNSSNYAHTPLEQRNSNGS